MRAPGLQRAANGTAADLPFGRRRDKGEGQKRRAGYPQLAWLNLLVMESIAGNSVAYGAITLFMV